MFSKVVFDDSIKTDIARVNRADGTLYLNPSIWARLTGLEREFVLLHEGGHLELMTADEYKANNYAVEKFIPVQTLSDAELGKRIAVVSKITDPANYISGNFFSDIVDAGSGLLGKVNDTLSIIGLGSKKRIKESNNQTTNNLLMMSKSSQGQKQMILIGGGIVVVIILIVVIFKMK